MTGRLRRAVHRLTTAPDELDAEQAEQEALEHGATPVAQCRDRSPVTVFGNVRSVTLRPRAGVPSLEAELFDGTGVVTLVWLGRRAIAGVEPGRQLQAVGRLTTVGGRRTVFNPRYTIAPPAG